MIGDTAMPEVALWEVIALQEILKVRFRSLDRRTTAV